MRHSIPARDKSRLSIFEEQLRRLMWLELSYRKTRCQDKIREVTGEGGDGVMSHARDISAQVNSTEIY